MEVLRGVFVLRGITATNMATDQAEPQVNPCIAHLQAFLAAIGTRGDFVNLVEVGASW
jgi:hypothetical protein